MPMIRAMRMLNAVEAGTTSGAQLQTLLADPGRLGEWNVLLGMRGQVRRMAASSTAMAAVAASSTAMAAVAASSTAMAAINANDQAVRIWMLAGTGQNYASFANVAAVAASSTAMAAVAASSTAMAAVIASSTAMAAVAASSTAMAAVAASSTARLAVYNSDVALSAISASATAKAAIRAASGYTIKAISNSGPTTIDFAGNVIMVGFSSSNANGDTTIAGRRAGSTVGRLTIAAAQTPINTTASFDNVMALTSGATTSNSWSTTTHYFGVLPV